MKKILFVLAVLIVGLGIYMFLVRTPQDMLDVPSEVDGVSDTAKEDAGGVHIYVKTTQGLFESVQQQTELFSHVEQQIIEDVQYTDPVVRLTVTYDNANANEVVQFLTDLSHDGNVFGSKVFFELTKDDPITCGNNCRVSVYAIPLSRLLSE